MNVSNIKMIGTLIFKDQVGANTRFYFDPQLVQLVESYFHKKLSRDLAIELLKTQLAFDSAFLAPEMADPSAHWSDLSMETYQGKSMYSVTYTPATPHEVTPRNLPTEQK